MIITKIILVLIAKIILIIIIIIIILIVEIIMILVSVRSYSVLLEFLVHGDALSFYLTGSEMAIVLLTQSLSN